MKMYWFMTGCCVGSFLCVVAERSLRGENYVTGRSHCDYCGHKLKWFDLIIPQIAIAQGFGRIGCLMAGCCYGREAHAHEWGIIFPDGCMAPAGVELIPTQVYSSIGNFAIAATLIIVDYATRKREGRIPGMLLGLYLILYGVGRFVVEIFRNDVRGSVGVLSTSQFISIFMVAAAIVIFVVLKVMGKKRVADL